MPVTLGPWPPSSKAYACPGLPEEADPVFQEGGHEGKNPSCFTGSG